MSLKKISYSCRILICFGLFVSCVKLSNNSKTSKLTDARSNAELYREIAENYKTVSNSVCVVPFFTESYDQAVAGAGSLSGEELMAILISTTSALITSDVAAAALAEFGGASFLTHSEIVTKSIHFIDIRIESASLVRIINQLPSAAGAFLERVAASEGLTTLEAVKVMLARRATAMGASEMLAAMTTQIHIPYAFEAFISHGTSLLAKMVDVMGYYGIFCALDNTLAAAFNAFAAENQTIATQEQLDQMGIDSCARMNSHKSYYNAACIGHGALGNFSTDAQTRCTRFLVDNDAGKGLRVFADQNMGYGIFRIGRLMNLHYLDSILLSNGFIVAKIQVDDSRSTYNGGVGWIYIGGVVCH